MVSLRDKNIIFHFLIFKSESEVVCIFKKSLEEIRVKLHALLERRMVPRGRLELPRSKIGGF